MNDQMTKKRRHLMSKKQLEQPDRPYLKLTLDLIFKAFFKDKSVSTPFLQYFLPLPKERKIVSIEFLDPIMTPEKRKLKTPVLDLRVQLDNKEHINIEMQTMNMKNFKERILYYLSSLYIEQLNRGTKYTTLYPAYSLVFTQYTVFPEFKEYCSQFFLQTDKKGGPIFSKHLGIVLVELEKFKASSCGRLIDKKDIWSYLIKNSHHISKKQLGVLSKKGGGMKEATKRLSVLSEDENLRMLEEAREKNWRDEQARRDFAIEEGLEKGIKQGKKEERNKMILKMLNENFDIASISKITGVSKVEILKLKNT